MFYVFAETKAAIQKWVKYNSAQFKARYNLDLVDHTNARRESSR